MSVGEKRGKAQCTQVLYGSCLSHFFNAIKYRPLTASVYSSMLLLVMLPPFGNTIFEATIPLSVTIIMSQFDLFTAIDFGAKIGVI